jgi:hypothetical protein
MTRLGALLAVAGSLLAPSLARADTVTDWNEITSNAIVVPAGQPPPVSVLSFAMVQGAVYDAVNAIDGGHQPYLAAPPAHRADSEDAAAATAAFRVLAGLFPALATPPFPDHPSGHNCAAGAIVPALQWFFGTDHVAFSATSAKSGTTRSFTRLSDVLREMIDARVWAGIHFRTADVQGARLGEQVARYERLHYFRASSTRRCHAGSSAASRNFAGTYRAPRRA